jgi:hypothetical protein
LKRVENVKCSFWDYKYGWVGSIHDYVFFRKTNLKSCVMKDKSLLYKLRRDATYLV